MFEVNLTFNTIAPTPAPQKKESTPMNPPSSPQMSFLNGSKQKNFAFEGDREEKPWKNRQAAGVNQSLNYNDRCAKMIPKKDAISTNKDETTPGKERQNISPKPLQQSKFIPIRSNIKTNIKQTLIPFADKSLELIPQPKSHTPRKPTDEKPVSSPGIYKIETQGKNLKDENKQIKDQSRQLREQNYHLREQNKQIREQNYRLAKEVDEMKKSLYFGSGSRKDDMITNLRSTVQRENKQIFQLRIRVDILSKQNSALTDMMASKEQQMDYHKQKQTQLSLQLAECRQRQDYRYDKLKQKMNLLMQAYEEMQDRMTRYQYQWENDIERWNLQKTAYLNKLEEMAEKMKDAELTKSSQEFSTSLSSF